MNRVRLGRGTAIGGASLIATGSRSNACASTSALLQFLLLQQLPLGPKPVLLVAASLLRLGDQVCPFGDPLRRNRLARGTLCARISLPRAGPYFRLFCGVGILFHCSLMIERTLAPPSLDDHVILASVTQEGEVACPTGSSVVPPTSRAVSRFSRHSDCARWRRCSPRRGLKK